MSKKKNHQFACSSMMLPEHRYKLCQHLRLKETREKYRLPDLSEEQQEEFQFILTQSLEKKLAIEVSIRTQGETRVIQGTVEKVVESGKIEFRTKEKKIRIGLDRIRDCRFL